MTNDSTSGIITGRSLRSLRKNSPRENKSNFLWEGYFLPRTLRKKGAGATRKRGNHGDTFPDYWLSRSNSPLHCVFCRYATRGGFLAGRKEGRIGQRIALFRLRSAQCVEPLVGFLLSYSKNNIVLIQ
jgi:hypothetical protein